MQEHLKDAVAGTLKLKRLLSRLIHTESGKNNGFLAVLWPVSGDFGVFIVFKMYFWCLVLLASVNLGCYRAR